MASSKDSVVNFLTPPKLITGALRTKPKNHPSDSLFSLSSNKQKSALPPVDDSKNYNSQLEKFNYGFNRSQEEVEVAHPDPYESREKYRSEYNHNFAFENPSKPMLKSEDNFRLNAIDKVETRSENPPQTSFILHKVEVRDEIQLQQPFPKLIQNSGVEQQPLKVSAARDNREFPIYQSQKSKDYYPGYSQNTQGLSSLVMQLRAIKDVIDTSLGELQYLLDNTSKFLNSIDEEYNRIKQRILDYTSQALDAGFTKYRQNMVNWAKYEEVELKTKLMVQQLEKTIKEDEVMIQELNKLSKNSRILTSKQTELNQKIELYSNFVNELQSSKVQCLSMRPQLKKDKILIFEQALTSLADF